ncbi:heavy-metal-associated domain-containing protein [Microvirga sp. 2TAF3]|uniref:heavy-metal-associated domain-containing protein n=1 Tax=Microvirga sp. 2TAF3 TaxID=3233014 RepID=UPI003F9DFCDC
MSLFYIPDMKCGGCLGAVMRAIHDIDRTARIAPNLERREIDVRSARSEARLLDALKEAGYPAQPLMQPLG